MPTANTSSHSARWARRETTEAVEDYVKAIYTLGQRDSPVTINAIAARLGVSAASASAMVRKLDQRGLAVHPAYGGVGLTDAGEHVALEVLRHHRLLELYLAEALGMPWDRVHEEAEVLEHVLSDELEEIISAKLGHPTIDPHGDPIPARDGKFHEPATDSFADLGAGAQGVFVRVSDSEPAMLRYLSERGISPGDSFEVVERQPFGGPLFVRFGSEVHVLGGDLAAAMRAEVCR
ncbi:MAG: metal-dependent transcriptional regulator [Actinomycetota bacterium]